MKTLLGFLLLVASALARSAVDQQSIFSNGPVCPLDDPLNHVESTPIDVSLHPIFNLDVGSVVSNLVIEGLSTLRYSYEVSFPLMYASFEITHDHVEGNATYAASGYIDARPISSETIPSGILTGSGFGKVSADGVHLKAYADLIADFDTNQLQIRTLTLENVKFDSLAMDLGTNIVIGGETVDWTDWSANIKDNFDREWAEHKTELTEKIRQALNLFVGQYTIEEIIFWLQRPYPC